MTDNAPKPEPQASFALSGPSLRADPATLPVRGDLAHIRLAGTVFVPHYAVPMPRVLAQDTALLGAARDDAESLATIAAGTCFEVLDIAGKWAWGCVSMDAPDRSGAVGYVLLDALKEA